MTITKRLFVAFLAALLLAAMPTGAGASEAPVADELDAETSDIIGGSDAKELQYPYLATLVAHGKDDYQGQFCGGVAIGAKWILTAAHCVTTGSGTTDKPANIDVIMGAHDLEKPQGHRIRACSIKRHPNYNHFGDFFDDGADIAVIKLCKAHHHPTVALPQNGTPPLNGSEWLGAGWGISDFFLGNIELPLFDPTLQKLKQKVTALDACLQIDLNGQGIFPSLAEINAFIGPDAKKDLICANTSQGSTCNGDSGGPLFRTVGGKTTVAGVVSFGPEACDNVTYYTNVGQYNGWIEKTTKLETSKPIKGVKCAHRYATILGNNKNNTLTGTSRGDTIVGLGGADKIDGKGGPDVICGGEGNDTIFGGAGVDLLNGDKGADKLTGGPGKDRCNGASGKDTAKSCEKKIGIP